MGDWACEMKVVRARAKRANNWRMGSGLPLDRHQLRTVVRGQCPAFGSESVSESPTTRPEPGKNGGSAR